MSPQAAPRSLPFRFCTRSGGQGTTHRSAREDREAGGQRRPLPLPACILWLSLSPAVLPDPAGAVCSIHSSGFQFAAFPTCTEPALSSSPSPSSALTGHCPQRRGLGPNPGGLRTLQAFRTVALTRGGNSFCSCFLHVTWCSRLDFSVLGNLVDNCSQ